MKYLVVLLLAVCILVSEVHSKGGICRTPDRCMKPDHCEQLQDPRIVDDTCAFVPQNCR
jgi:hypothetical protein